jgi:hypothetical protein
MNTTERNWSAIQDYQNTNFGQRSFYTRQQWIEQCFDWCDGGLTEVEDMDEEQRDYWDWLNEIDDEELMHYIQENWEIEIRETTWLKVGNQCYWKDPAGETSGIYTIEEIRYDPNDYDDSLSVDTIILISNGYGEAEVTLNEIYGLTSKTCPKCGSPLYVSDLCLYECVCLECDENF